MTNTPSAPPDWIFNEDAALKYKLQGLTVNDVNAPAGGRPVLVRYRLPEDELANLSYPIIILEHEGIYNAPERAHRGYIQYPYAPEGYPAWWAATDHTFDPTLSPYYGYYPQPVNMDYSVTLYSRLSHFHLVPLIQTLSTMKYLPPQFGKIEVPQDHTYRTMMVTGGPDFGYGSDQDGKRRYWVSWRVRIFSEIFLDPILAMGSSLFPVSNINFNLGVYGDVNDLDYLELTESFGILSVGSPYAWNVDIPPLIPEAETAQPARHIRPQPVRIPARKPRRSPY